MRVLHSGRVPIHQGRMTGGGGGAGSDCTAETKEQNGNNNVIFRLIIDGDYHQNIVFV